MEKDEGTVTLGRWIADATRIIVFTGAGVSTESGIPDFRSPGGIWDRYDPREFRFQRFLSSESARETYWRMHSELFALLSRVRPNPAHQACVDLHREGKLDCVITQNVDDLHRAAGLPEEKVIEIHGNALRVACLDCGAAHSRAEVQAWIDAGEKVPRCRACGGLLKPTTISFGQALPEDRMEEAIARLKACDLLIAAGSSLVVHPAAAMPVYAREAGAKLVIVNRTETPFDRDADCLIRGEAGAVLAEAMRRAQAILRAFQQR